MASGLTVESTGLCIVQAAPPATREAEPEYLPPAVRLIENRNPFRPEEKRLVELEPLEGETVGAIVARAGFKLEKYVVSVAGKRLTETEIAVCQVKVNDELVLFPRAAGGNWTGILGMVAGLVAAAALIFFTGGLMAPLLSTIGAQLAFFGGSAAIGAAMMSWALAPGQPKAPDFSTTYDPTGPKSLAQAGTPVPKAYGAMGWGGNCIASYVDYAGKDAYIRALYCFGFGVATSITDILINQKSISTYTNTSYYVRYGTNDQTPIDGFNKTVNGYPQEVELLVANGPVVVQGTGTDVEGLEITIKLPTGLYHISHDGNFVPLEVAYQVQVSPHNLNDWTDPLFPRNYGPITTTHEDGSVTWPLWVVLPTDRFKGSGICYAYDDGPHNPGDPWSQSNNVDVYDELGDESTVTQTFTGEWQPCDPSLGLQEVTGWWEGIRVLNGDQTTAYFDTVLIYGLTAGQWDVRVTKLGYQEPGEGFEAMDTTDAHYVSDIWLWNINEVTFSDLAYPNMILVGIEALATTQLSGASLQLMATITHDLGTDTALPAALSGFEHDNPALVAWDVLTNPLYGMGVAASLIDVPAFVAWAEFCDEPVPIQDGSTARRFIFAGVFDQSSDAWKTLNTIGNMSRAQVVPLGMQYTVVLDAPGDPVQLFTVGNMTKDSFQEMWIALDDRCTLIEATFADAARSYRTDLPVSVMTAADMNSGLAPKITRTNLIGCTSRDQAWAWAYYHLMSTKLTLRSINFKAPVEAVCSKIGSVIAVQCDVTQWAAGGRIQPGSTLSAVNVELSDLTFTSESVWTVSVQHPAVQRGTATVLSIAGNVVTMTAALPAGRILKAVGPDGTEYVVRGYGGSAITLANLQPQAATVPLAAGQAVQLWDVNIVEDFQVTAMTPTASGATLSIAPAEFSAAPSCDSGWAYGQTAGAQPAKLFRVLGMKQSGDFEFEIAAVEYNAELYTDVTPNYGEIVEAPSSNPTLSNLTLTEVYQNGTVTGSTSSSQVAVGWQPGGTCTGGIVSYSTDAGTTWKPLGVVQNSSGTTFVGAAGVTYLVKVIPIDGQGNQGTTPATASITVVAGTAAPGNVTGFQAVMNTTGNVLTWNAVTGAASYEIRYVPPGSVIDFVNAEVLWDGTGTTWTDTSAGLGIYYIVAVSSLATGSVQSITPAACVVQNPYNLASLQALLETATVGFSGTELALMLPAGTVLEPNGTPAAVSAQTLTWTGTPAASTTYYVYAWLDVSLTLHAAPAPASNPLPDTAPSNTDLATSQAGGLASFLFTFTTNSTGTGGAGSGVANGGGAGGDRGGLYSS
ncbi:MAG: phage tail protein [Acidobacteriaceae bacterium]